MSSYINTIVVAIPKVADGALRLLVGFLGAITKNIGKVVKAAVDLVVAFLDALGKQLPRLVDAGAKFIINLVNGIAQSIRANSAQLGEAGANLALAIVEGMVKGIGAGIGRVTEAAKNLAKSALNAAKSFLGIASPSKEFEKVGKFVTEGFVKGLKGGKEDVLKSYTTMRDLLSLAMKSAQEDVAGLERKLASLNKAKVKDIVAIRQTNTALSTARSEVKATTAAHAELTKNLIDERHKLEGLGTKYDNFTKKIQAANQVLADAKRTRDDYNKSVRDQYADLPDIGAETTVDTFKVDLEDQIAQTKEFATALQKLRAMGLGDALYKELLAKGVAALPFVRELVLGGSAAVKAVVTMSSDLEKEAAKLGTSASTALYQAGVDSAQGILKGLQSQQSALARQMEVIATTMVNALKKKLAIKSPSEEFSKLGVFSAQGLAKGFISGTSDVTGAAEFVANSAVQNMRNALLGLSDSIDGNLSLNPTITPILDLSGVRRDASALGSLIPSQALNVGTSYSQASGASQGYSSNKAAASDLASKGPEVIEVAKFEQNNYSPKALSHAELYRQTKNLVSVSRGVVNI